MFVLQSHESRMPVPVDSRLVPPLVAYEVGKEPAGYHKGADDSYSPCTRHVDTENVHVIIMADEGSFIGLMALANSIVQNTNSDVMFHFVTFPSDAQVLRRWISGSKLANLSHEIVELSRERLKGKYLVRSPRKDLASPMNFARVLLPDLLPCVGKVIFIDADCLVLGNIRELYDLPLEENHMVAGVDMCEFTPKSRGKWPTIGLVLNYSHPEVGKASIPKDSCMMNGGMYMADLIRWDRYNISQQLQFWMELNAREPVYRYSDLGSGTQAVLNTVLHDKFTSAPKEWNTVSGSHKTVLHPKLIHWNGAAKPWSHPTVSFFSEWIKYYVPDPDARIRLRNVWREKKLV